MAKKNNAPEIDEQGMIASFLEDNSENLGTYVSNTEAEGEDESPKSKAEDSRRKSRESNYETIFIKPSTIPARVGKMAFIRTEYHETITMLIRVVGENRMTIAGYLDHVLSDHFERYAREIERLYAEKVKSFSVPGKAK